MLMLEDSGPAGHARGSALVLALATAAALLVSAETAKAVLAGGLCQWLPQLLYLHRTRRYFNAVQAETIAMGLIRERLLKGLLAIFGLVLVLTHREHWPVVAVLLAYLGMNAVDAMLLSRAAADRDECQVRTVGAHNGTME